MTAVTAMNFYPLHSGGGSPAILTIAGSDSGGGAGIQVSRSILSVFNTDELQADLKTFTSLGCYGTSVVTALTAQNTKGVQAVHTVPPPFVEEQVRRRRYLLPPAPSTIERCHTLTCSLNLYWTTSTWRPSKRACWPTRT